MLKTDQNQAPPVPWVSPTPTSTGPTPASRPCSRHRGHRRVLGHPRLPRPAREVPAAIRQRILVPERLHLRQDHRPHLGQRRHGDPDQHLRPRLQPRAGRLRRDPHAQLELDLRAALRPAEPARRLAGQRDRLLAHRPARHDHADRAMLSTGVSDNRPDRIGDGSAADPTVEQWFDPTAFVQTADRTGHLRHRGPEHPARAGPVQRGPVAAEDDPLRARHSSSCGSKLSTCSITRSSRRPTPSFGSPGFGSDHRPCSRTPPAPRAGRRSGRSSSG